VIERPLDWHRLAATAGGSDHEAGLQLDVEPFARTEVAAAPLAAWPRDDAAGGDHRSGAPVVAHRQVAPVRHQRLALGPEHATQVGRVVDRGEEVDEVGDLEGQRELGPLDGARLLLDARSELAPVLGGACHEGVQGARRERLVESAQVEHALPHPRAYTAAGQHPVGKRHSSIPSALRSSTGSRQLQLP
jgi:hypothetical protein